MEIEMEVETEMCCVRVVSAGLGRALICRLICVNCVGWLALSFKLAWRVASPLRLYVSIARADFVPLPFSFGTSFPFLHPASSSRFLVFLPFLAPRTPRRSTVPISPKAPLPYTPYTYTTYAYTDAHLSRHRTHASSSPRPARPSPPCHRCGGTGTRTRFDGMRWMGGFGRFGQSRR